MWIGSDFLYWRVIYVVMTLSAGRDALLIQDFIGLFGLLYLTNESLIWLMVIALTFDREPSRRQSHGSTLPPASGAR
jgi:hypothetical protein